MMIIATTDALVEDGQSAPTTNSETGRDPQAGRPVRRRFTAEYKRRIVAEYDPAPAGSKGQVLRREGLFDSSVKQWRAQIEAGTLGRGGQGKASGGHIGGTGALRRAGKADRQARVGRCPEGHGHRRS